MYILYETTVKITHLKLNMIEKLLWDNLSLIREDKYRLLKKNVTFFIDSDLDALHCTISLKNSMQSFPMKSILSAILMMMRVPHGSMYCMSRKTRRGKF